MSKSNDEPDVRAAKSEIRMDHFEQKAAADKFVTEQQALTLAGHIDELVDGVKQLAAGVAGLHYAEHRRNKLLLISAILVFAFGVVFLLNFAKTFDNQNEIKRSGQILRAATGCTDVHTPAQCSDQLKKKSQNEGNRRVLAVECVVRGVRDGESRATIEQKCLPKETP